MRCSVLGSLVLSLFDVETLLHVASYEFSRFLRVSRSALEKRLRFETQGLGSARVVNTNCEKLATSCRKGKVDFTDSEIPDI